jgi:hypothetical protein
MTDAIATAFTVAALAAVLLSSLVMASRPWGCSTSSESPVITCDWVTSRVIAAIWLLAALGVCVVSWKGWKLPLTIISLPLLAVSLISVIGVFSLAPAAFWLASAMWRWRPGRRSTIGLTTLASLLLLYLAMNGVVALLVLRSTPV